MNTYFDYIPELLRTTEQDQAYRYPQPRYSPPARINTNIPAIIDKLGLEHLPLQRQLIASCLKAFEKHEDVVAAVLVGSLAGGKGDRISDADILLLTRNAFHKKASHAYQEFESDKAIAYTLTSPINDTASFRKYLLEDLTSIEIHCVDLEEKVEIAKPFQVLFDKGEVIAARLTDKPAPKHKDFPVYDHGDEGLIWELFECIKWLSRGNNDLAKGYIKRLAAKLSSSTQEKAPTNPA